MNWKTILCFLFRFPTDCYTIQSELTQLLLDDLSARIKAWLLKTVTVFQEAETDNASHVGNVTVQVMLLRAFLSCFLHSCWISVFRVGQNFQHKRQFRIEIFNWHRIFIRVLMKSNYFFHSILFCKNNELVCDIVMYSIKDFHIFFYHLVSVTPGFNDKTLDT